MLKIRSKPLAFMVMIAMLLTMVMPIQVFAATTAHVHVKDAMNVSSIVIHFTSGPSLVLTKGDGNKWQAPDEGERTRDYLQSMVVGFESDSKFRTYEYPRDFGEQGGKITEPVEFSDEGQGSGSINLWLEEGYITPSVTPGSITINKDVLVDGDDRTAFTFKVYAGTSTEGELVSTVEAAEGSPGTVANLTPGAYTVEELSEDGYSVSGSAVQTNIEVTTGANKDVYFENTKDPSDQTYEIDLVKTANVTQAAVGQQITYRFVFTNSGSEPLYNIALRDYMLTTNHNMIVTPGPLLPGESFTSELPYTIPTGTAFPLVNNAVATGHYGEKMDQIVTDSGTWSIADIGNPPPDKTYGIDLEKSATPTNTTVGTPITYTFTITNTGNQPLVHVTLEDPYISINPAWHDLAAGETVTYAATYTPASLPFTNIATVTGYDTEKEGMSVTDSATATVTLYTAPPPPPYDGGDDDDDYTPPPTIIPTEPTPLAPIEEPAEEPIALVEEETPLAALPQTGETDPLIFLGLGALLALAGYRLTRKAEEKQ